ncbi:MAG: PAS domain-containing protein [Rhodospirillaceae bacterium]|nr:PAS domain-containing protein [Rhodospirillaceae bacterium]
MGQSFQDPIAALSAYWSSLNEGRVPERAMVELSAIPSLLPLLLLTAFEQDPFRVRYRLTGTRVDEWNGMNLAGLYLDELNDEGDHGAIAKLMASYRQCHDSAAPVIDRYDWPARSGGFLTVRYGLFPLASNGMVCQCLGIEDYSALPRLYDGVPLSR